MLPCLKEEPTGAAMKEKVALLDALEILVCADLTTLAIFIGQDEKLTYALLLNKTSKGLVICNDGLYRLNEKVIQEDEGYERHVNLTSFHKKTKFNLVKNKPSTNNSLDLHLNDNYKEQCTRHTFNALIESISGEEFNSISYNNTSPINNNEVILITEDEVVKIIDKSPATLYRLRVNKNFPNPIISHPKRYDKAEILKWLNENSLYC